MSLIKFLVYNNLYNDFDKIDPIQFINDIPTEKILFIFSRINCILWSRESDIYIQNYLLKGFTNDFLPESKFYIENLFSKNPQYYNYNIFNNISTLLSEKFVVRNYSLNERVLDSNDMENIFKLILYFNQVYNEMIHVDIDVEKKDFLSLSLALGFAQNGFIPSNQNHVNFLIKGYYFFKFLETNKIFKSHLQDYIESKGAPSYNFYLSHIINILIRYSNPDKQKIPDIEYELIVEPELDMVIQFINNMSIHNQKHLFSSEKIEKSNVSDEDFDFKLFRNFPFYKKENNKFYFFSLNFLADKLSMNLKFDFKNFIDNKSDVKGKPTDMLSYLSKEFTEKYLFRKILNSILNNKNMFLKEGKDESDNTAEYGDYYARAGNKVLLFECKDSIIKSEIKYSYESSKIKSLLLEKFSSKKAGLIQYLNTIENITKDSIKFDNYVINNKDKLKIYPILIYTDIILESNGVNYYINNEFNTLKSKYDFPFQVNNLVMINLDFLIKFKNIFEKNLTKFLEIVYLFSHELRKEIIFEKFDPSEMYPTIEEKLQFYFKEEINNIEHIKDKELEKILEEIRSY